MRTITLAVATAATILGGGAAYAASPMPMDNPVAIDGTETVCTGIGEEAQTDPRWPAYPIRLEFSNGGSQYLSGAHVTLKNAEGKTLADLDCAGSWVLFKLAPGNYAVSASLLWQASETRSAKFSTPATGQKRVVLQFTNIAPNQ